MPIFNYTAADEQGKKVTGSVDARSKDIAVNLIKQKGFYLLSISEKRASLIDEALSFAGVPKSEIVSFTRQFSTMVSAGLPIANSLEVLVNQTTNKLLKEALVDVLRAVEGGSTLSAALARHPTIFNVTYQSLVTAGESSGSLDVILDRLAQRLEEERELEAKFKGAMIYPVIVTLAMIGVFFILMIFVVPKLADMYKNLNVPLPVVTQVMINTSNFMINNKFLMLLIIGFSFFGMRLFLKSPQGSKLFSDIMFIVPVFGKINRLRDLDQFTSTLALLLSSAVPIVESLNIISGVVNNSAYKAAAKDAAIQVEKGMLLSDYFKANPIFPALVAQMAGVGQETGKMDEVLGKISKYFKTELDHLIDGLSAALEPIILVTLGIMVGFMIISIITPIYKITSAL